MSEDVVVLLLMASCFMSGLAIGVSLAIHYLEGR